jgi:hypothetical protein
MDAEIFVMERFIPAFDETHQLEYDRLRADADWQRIYAFIRVDLWHVTSIGGWCGIQESGTIEPNVANRYPKRFGDITDRSFGYIKRYVSLFDFGSPTQEQVMRFSPNRVQTLVLLAFFTTITLVWAFSLIGEHPSLDDGICATVGAMFGATVDRAGTLLREWM